LQRLEKLANREGKAVEDLAAEIFHQALADRDPDGTWLDEVSGSFANDPEFDDVVSVTAARRPRDAHRDPTMPSPNDRTRLRVPLTPSTVIKFLR
jgi:hypothetical protein